MNQVILLGRLTSDPEYHQANADKKSRCKYTIAVNRYGEGADFIQCLCFDKQADLAEKYFAKGSKVCVMGNLNTGSYDKADGTKVYYTQVIVQQQEFCETKSDSKGKVANTANSKPNDKFVVPDRGIDGFASIPEGIDEELPFA